MSTASQRLVGTAVAVGGSCACAVVLHGAVVRPEAVLILPLVLAWGAAAIRTAVDARHRGWGLLLLAALAVRAPLVGTPPLLSDDLYRYLFEGLALAAGHNPFVEPPAAVSGVDDTLRGLVNHPEVTTVYPPLALAWFRLLALGRTATAVQAATALVDAVVPLALLAATRRAWPAWVYALHPLPALEAASGGHIDVLAVALAAAGLAAWRRGHLDAGWLAIAAGALVKLFPLVLLPTLLRRVRLGRQGLWLAALAAATLLLALPVLDAGPTLGQGLATYSAHWSFNGLLYPWLEPALGEATRPLLVATAGAIVGVATLRHPDPGRVWLTAGAAFVLLSPTVHPWYALWVLVPSLGCQRLDWAVATLPLTLSYTVLLALDPETGAWAEAPWLWWVTWPPAILALTYFKDWSATTPYPEANNSRNGSEAT